MKLPSLILFCFSLLLINFTLNLPCLALGVSAGTEIVSEAEFTWNGHKVTLESSSIKVGQIHGLELTALQTDASVIAGTTFYSAHRIANVGNGTDVISFSLSDTTDKFTSTLLVDTNGDTVHVSTETTPVPIELTLAEDASYNLFVVLTSSVEVLKDTEGKTIFNFTGKGSDGGAYVGADGKTYGGPDTTNSEVKLYISEAYDIIPPAIIDFTINKKKRFDGDIISKNLAIEITVKDNISNNIDSIEIWQMLYKGKPIGSQATSSQLIANSISKEAAYDSTEEKLIYVHPTPLSPGKYGFEIRAWDKSGNGTSESISSLEVKSDGAIGTEGPVANYPNPFSPLRGEITHIGYYLNTDLDVTIYLFNIVGSAVWKRTYAEGFEGGMAGYNEIDFNGFSDFGEILGNGIYIYKLANNNKVIGKGKLTVLD